MVKILLGVILMLVLSGCPDTDDPYESYEPTLYSVSYEATCTTGTADLTIENDTGGTSQFADEPTPWTYVFSKKKPPGTFVYVSAQNNQDSGTVTVTIYRDGVVFKTSTSTGAYVIASAYGSL